MAADISSAGTIASIVGRRVCRLTLLALLAWFAIPSIARADVIVTVGVAGADSSRDAPLTITAYNDGGVGFPVNVTTIKKGDTGPAKAGKIVTAITTTKAYPFTATQRFAGNPPRPDIVFTIAGTSKIKFGKDVTMEGLDKLNMGRRDIEFTARLGGAGTASGEDSSGATSVVRVGIEDPEDLDGSYVASVSPSEGEPFVSVLADLIKDLYAHDIVATAMADPLEPLDYLLTFANGIPGNADFVFGNTDTGLSTYALVAVPEPSTAMLLGSAGLIPLALRRRHGQQMGRARVIMRRMLVAMICALICVMPTVAPAKDIQLKLDDAENPGAPSITLTDAQNKELGKAEVTFDKKVTAQEKRDALFDALDKAKFPLKVEKKAGVNDTLIFKDVPKGSTITFANGGTGEFNEVLTGMDPISQGTITFRGEFNEFTSDGVVASFQAGFFSDLGATMPLVRLASSLPGLEGADIADAFFLALAPLTPPLGILLSHPDRSETIVASYDPTFTIGQGGIIFGTNSSSGDVIGSLTEVSVPPNPLLFGAGMIAFAGSCWWRKRARSAPP